MLGEIELEIPGTGDGNFKSSKIAERKFIPIFYWHEFKIPKHKAKIHFIILIEDTFDRCKFSNAKTQLSWHYQQKY